MQDKQNPPQDLENQDLAEKANANTAVPSAQQSSGLLINEEIFSDKLFSDEPLFSDSTNSSTTTSSASNASSVSSEELLFTDEAQSTSQNNNDSEVLFSDVPTPDTPPQTDKPTQTASSEVLFAAEPSSSEEILFTDDTISDDDVVIFAETPVDNTAVTNDMLFAAEQTATVPSEVPSMTTENHQPASTATSEELLFTDEPVFADEPASNSEETLFADDSVADTVNDDDNILIAETAVDNVAITDDVLFADEASQKEQTQETAVLETTAQEANETTTTNTEANTEADTEETLFADEPVFSDAAPQTTSSEALFADEASSSEELLFADDSVADTAADTVNDDDNILIAETAVDNVAITDDALFSDEPNSSEEILFSDETANETATTQTLFADEPAFADEPVFSNETAPQPQGSNQSSELLMSPVAALTRDVDFQKNLNATSANAASPLQENIALQTLAQDTSLTARLGFLVGNTPLLIPVIEGDLLIDVPDIFKLPNTASWFLGYSNINGNLTPIFDIADFLNLKHNSQTMQEQALATAQSPAADDSRPMQKLLVVMHDEDAAGIIINSLPKKLNLQSGERLSVDTAQDTLAPYLATAVRIEEQIWFDLNIESLLDAIETNIG